MAAAAARRQTWGLAARGLPGTSDGAKRAGTGAIGGRDLHDGRGREGSAAFAAVEKEEKDLELGKKRKKIVRESVRKELLIHFLGYNF